MIHQKRHTLLTRQLKKHFGEGISPPECLEFIDAVEAAYRQFDDDRGMLERSLDLSSQELLESNAQMRAMLQAFPDLYFHLDAQGLILDCSTSRLTDLRLSPEDFTGRRVQSVFPKETMLRFEAALRQVVETGTMAVVEYRLAVPSGEKHWEARIVNTSEGHLLMIARDVTERVKTAEALRHSEEKFHQAQRMEGIGRLAGGIAHDFNNILTVILGLSETILLELAKGHPAAADIEEIRLAGRRAADLTQQLLAFSRRQMIAPRVTGFDVIIPKVTTMLRRLIGEDVELITRIGPGLGRVRVDPGQMEQLIVNLAINARDAMPVGGKLAIEAANCTLDDSSLTAELAAPPGDYVKLSFIDTGTGMSAAVQEHIFEPFFTTKELGKGTGLGLATCYGIVKQHSGFIYVRSSPGIGTTFDIYFPKCIEDAPAPVPAAPTRAARRGSESVLVVEDEPSVRGIATRALRAQGYTVQEASDGEAALALIRSDEGKSLRLVLSDVIMPRMNGKELADELRRIRPDIKVLLVTGYMNESIRVGLPDSRIGIIRKPYTIDDLTGAVQSALDEPPLSERRS